MARFHKIATDFGFVRTISFKQGENNIYRVSVSVVKTGETGVGVLGDGTNIGEVIGRSGNYSIAGAGVDYAQFVTFTAAVEHLVGLWLQGRGAGYVPAEPVAEPVQEAPTLDEVFTLFGELVSAFVNDRTDDESAVLDCAAAYHLLRSAQAPKMLPASCESGRHAHCPACGDPVTYALDTRHGYTTGERSGYRIPVNGSHIVKMGGYGPIRRYCAKCINFARWLALPEGGDQVRILYKTDDTVVIDGNSYLNDLPVNRDIDFTFRYGLLTLELN